MSRRGSPVESLKCDECGTLLEGGPWAFVRDARAAAKKKEWGYRKSAWARRYLDLCPACDEWLFMEEGSPDRVHALRSRQ